MVECEYAPAAFKFLNDTILDPAAPMRCRVDSAKIIVNLAGYVAGAPAATAFNKQLEAMSIGELEKLIGDLSRQRAAAAKDITREAMADENDGAHPPADDAPRH